MPRLPFRRVAQPWQPFAPPRSLNPAEGGPAWRDLTNLRAHNGALEFRRAVRQPAGTVTQPPVDYASLATAGVRVELPMYIAQMHDGFITGTPFKSSVGTVLVTTTDIYSHTAASGWRVLTPIYNTGTISYTNGNVNVTGVGTNWLTLGISPGQLIKLGANYHQIAAVTGAGALSVTIAPTSTAAGVAYEIRRTFNHTVPWNQDYFTDRAVVFARMFNGDLYVAGTEVGGIQNPAVVRVVDPFGAAPVTSYLVASIDLTGSLHNFPMNSIQGLLPLQDGRVVIAVTEQAGSARRVSRLRFSSLTDQAIWTASPGGFVDVVNGGKGRITALGQLGDYVTAHYADAIVLGLLTGQADRPLDLRGTRATAGCGYPRTLAQAAGGEWYMDALGDIRVFDGSADQLVTSDFRRQLADYPILQNSWYGFGHLDKKRSEYQVFVPAEFDFVTRTLCLATSTRDAATRKEHYGFPFTAISDEYLSSPGVSAPVASGSHEEAEAIIGLTVANIAANDDPLAVLRERIGEDDTAVQSHLDAGDRTEAISDELDFGEIETEKALVRVVVRLRKPADSLSASTSDTIEVAFSSDGGLTYAATQSQTFTYSGAGAPDTQRYHFTLASALTWKMRLRSSLRHKLIGQIEWIDIDYRTPSADEAAP